MRTFVWYPFIGAVLVIHVILATFLFPATMPIAVSLNNIAVIFHFSFLSVFIIRRIRSPKNLVPLWSGFAFFNLLIIYLLANHGIQAQTQAHQAFAIASAGLSFFCISYFYHLFHQEPFINLKREPAFYIISGVFVAMSLNIPLCAAVGYFQTAGIVGYKLLYNLMAFTYPTMHLFFIKAYLCSVQRERT